MLLGIDTGGTFTDFVWFDGEGIRIHKVLSTPDAPARAIMQGIEEMELDLETIERVVHGTTVATNAVLEGKGARTAYITNRGLADVLTIGRQARPNIYDLMPQTPPPPVPAEACLETGGRLNAEGEVVEPLSEAALKTLVDQIRKIGPEAVAINLLFSYIDDRFERAIERALPDDLFISRSSAILPEQREYERGVTTWLNAYVGPIMQGYLGRLGNSLSPARLAVMRSSGQTCSAAQAGSEAVHLLLSGPAGGLSAARFIGKKSDKPRLLTIDMGGTSTDVALIDGDISLTSQGHIGQYPVGVAMVNMHTIGAGGGSLATIDAGGLLQVGPGSAGADPGPVCYGRGGEVATVTDANLVLGRLPRTAKLAGNMPLDYLAAHSALLDLASNMGMDSAEAAADGVIRIADEHMSQALRVISVMRGVDPREFTLMAFGGAGGLHLCALAESLGIRKALAPIHAGVLSALGMLTAPAGRQLSKTVGELICECPLSRIKGVLDELREEGRRELAGEGFAEEALTETESVDLCYRGQSSTLNLAWRGVAATCQAFHESHEARYGHRLDSPIELVNVKLGVEAPTSAPELKDQTALEKSPEDSSQLYGLDEPVTVYTRLSLETDTVYEGPVIITDHHATVYVAPGWSCQRDSQGHLHLQR